MIRLSWTIILEFSILILTDWKIANFNGFNFNPGQSFTLGSLSSSNEVWRVIIFIFSPPSSEHYHEKFVARAKLSLAMREGKLWVMLQLLTSHSPDCWCAGRQSWPDRETTPGWPIRWLQHWPTTGVLTPSGEITRGNTPPSPSQPGEGRGRNNFIFSFFQCSP